MTRRGYYWAAWKHHPRPEVVFCDGRGMVATFDASNPDLKEQDFHFLDGPLVVPTVSLEHCKTCNMVTMHFHGCVECKRR